MMKRKMNRHGCNCKDANLLSVHGMTRVGSIEVTLYKCYRCGAVLFSADNGSFADDRVNNAVRLALKKRGIGDRIFCFHSR